MSHVYSRAFSLLLVALAFLVLPAQAQIAGTAENNDRYGSSVAVGDFNGDGRDDLATGVPGENDAAGAVNVVYGTPNLLTTAGNQNLASNTPLAGDQYGYAVAAGDFDGDGFDDLAIGAPTYAIGATSNAGTIVVWYGTASGLSISGIQFINQGSIGSNVEAGDLFGFALASGDFNGDGRDDLAVGAPKEDIAVGGTNTSDTGGINVIYGAPGGLSLSGAGFFVDTVDPEAGDNFGWALTSGDFNGDGRDDLAVGAPLEDVGSFPDAGRICYFYGSAGGITTSGSGDFHQANLGAAVETGDQFGYTLASGDFNGDGRDDVVAGANLEDIGSTQDAGSFAAIYGSASGLVAAGAQFIDQNLFGNNAEAGDQFSYALTTGDFDGDGRDDVVSGAPFEDLASIVDAGLMGVVYGTASGLSSSRSRQFRQDEFGNSSVSPGDRFSFSLAGGDFNGDGVDDVAIGTPLEDHGPATDAGAVNVLYGLSGFGLNIGVNQLLYQGAGIFVVAGEDEPAVSAVSLQAPRPNPATDRSLLTFELPEAGVVRLAVYDVLGHEVAVLAEGERAAGTHTVTFGGQGLAAGVYVVRLESDGAVQTQRLTLAR